MTAGELIAFLQKYPENTPVVIINGQLTYSLVRPEERQMYRTVSGTYSRFWSEGQQHRNDTTVIVIR